MKPARPVPADPSALREARRAEALRLNLRRRKVSDAGAPADEPARGEAEEGQTGSDA